MSTDVSYEPRLGESPPLSTLNMFSICSAVYILSAWLSMFAIRSQAVVYFVYARLSTPLSIDLCARWLHDDDDIEDRFIAFRLLIELHEELYPCLYAFLQKPCLSKGPFAFIAAAPSVAEIETIRLHRMLLAYYRQVLRANRLLPKHLLWDGSLLSKLLFPPHPDTDVRLLAARCYASYVSMAKIERVCDKGAVMDVAELADGSNKKPRHSIRTLARALMFAAYIAGPFRLRRALW
ncbi:uncharacterized protein HD556DRAFT_1471547 [Suillus plorans]|uniref:Midasin AAA lid domain-containing protein n=1 Tax=Suillus plorans TaxID=116603 RepID=A0A9P7DJQ0_9AGAM|nr:uncharacterized protein HD556DRAFT_1471547 [Suillus plorans]KAG1796060.1 hypothetical protein HD556DRAFT_1471547 [Suillus plorans]